MYKVGRSVETIHRDSIAYVSLAYWKIGYCGTVGRCCVAKCTSVSAARGSLVPKLHGTQPLERMQRVAFDRFDDLHARFHGASDCFRSASG